MGLPQNYVTVSRRPPDVEDYIDMFRRYRSWIIAPMYVGLVASVVVAFLWPNTYVSRAVMRVTPQQVSERLIPATVNMSISERITQMEEKILSRTNLEMLIDKPSLDLYKKEKLQMPREEIVQQMRNNYIHVAPQVAPGAGPEKGATSFYISFSYSDPYIAQKVVRELVTMFIEENVNVQRNEAQATSSFLDFETKEAKRKLDNLSAELLQFTTQNQGKLPQQFQSNVQMESTLEFQSGQLNADLAQANAQKMSLETSLKGFQAQYDYYANKTETTVTPGPTATQNQTLINVSNQLLQAQSLLAGMRKQFGENWPDVKALKGQIDVLTTKLDELEKEQAKKDATVVPVGPVKITDPQVQALLLGYKSNIDQTKTSIMEAQLAIDRIVNQQAALNKRMAAYQSRIESAPLSEQKFVSLNQELTLAKEAYEGFVKRREQSATSQNLEEHKAGENLEVEDQASFPEKPTEPNRPAWAGIGTGMGLLLGIMLAGAKEMKNTSLKNLKDVRAYTNMPVLTSIPLLENALLVRRKRRLFWLAWSSAVIVGLMAMGAAVYYYYFGSK